MRFDGNRSLRNLKFYFEIEIFIQYKVSVLKGGLNLPWGQISPSDGVLFLLTILCYQADKLE